VRERRVPLTAALATGTLGSMSSRDWALEQRVRGAARLRFEQLSNAWFAILQSALAAGVAWLLARLIVGQPPPFFAPGAAGISLGLPPGPPRGPPRRRAFEPSIGVALGIGIAAAIVHLIGVGALQVTILVALV